MFYEDEDADFYDDEIVEEDFQDNFEEEVYFNLPSSPDPMMIAAATIVVGLFLFGLLTHLTFRIFGDAFTTSAFTTADQSSNSDQVNNNEESKPSTWNGECEVSQQYPAKVTRWCGLITQYAQRHNLDPDLVAALIWLESGGNELAYSRSGAVGLMQVMPRDGLAESFMCVNGPCFKDRPTSDELRDPEFNLSYGTRFLAGLVRKYGNLREALRSYGPMDAGYTYSDKVLNIFNRYNSD